MSVKVNYKGDEILSADTDISKTLKTLGKYCEDDFEIVNTQDGGEDIENAVAFTINENNQIIGATLYGPVIFKEVKTSNVSVAKPIKRFADTNVFYGTASLTSVPSADTLEYISAKCFGGCTGLTDVSLPEWTDGGTTAQFIYCSNLRNLYAPKLTKLGYSYSGYAFQGCTSLETIQLGSVGHSFTFLHVGTFDGDEQFGLTITIYTKSNYVDEILTNTRASAINAVIIIKASESTVYNGVAYSAGDTIITDTPSA